MVDSDKDGKISQSEFQDVKLTLAIRRRPNVSEVSKERRGTRKYDYGRTARASGVRKSWCRGNQATGVAWDAALIRDGSQLNDECEAKLAEITIRLRQEFDLSE